jgi:hypothetical protein
LGAFADVEDRLVVAGLDLDGGVGGVDGVLERPGRLLGEADLGVGAAGFQLFDQLDDGDLVGVQVMSAGKRW